MYVGVADHVQIPTELYPSTSEPRHGVRIAELEESQKVRYLFYRQIGPERGSNSPKATRLKGEEDVNRIQASRLLPLFFDCHSECRQLGSIIPGAGANL